MTISRLRGTPWLAFLLGGCRPGDIAAADDTTIGASAGSSGAESSGVASDGIAADTSSSSSTGSSSTSSSSTSSSSTDSSAAETTASIDATSTTGATTETMGTATSTGGTTGSDNSVPEPHDDALVAFQDHALVVNPWEGLLLNDVDADGDNLTVVAADALTTQGGTVTVAVDGAVMYDPPAGFHGGDGFGYTVTDGRSEASAHVAIEVVPPAIPLANISAGIGGFVLRGEASYDLSGHAVRGAGDVDGDGLDDVIVGADGSDVAGESTGRSYVVFGKADTSAVELADVVMGVGGFAIDGEVAGDRAGFALDAAGDVNGDGLADLVVGATGADIHGSYSGRSYVVFGKADTETVDLAQIAAGIGGFALDGEALLDRSGRAVGGAGDVDGDGFDDVLIGAFGSDATGADAGRSYVVFGKADTDLVDLADIASGTGGFTIDGEGGGDYSGITIGAAGDVDGDGLADIVVGASSASPSGANSGRSYVVFGKADTDGVALTDIAMGIGGFAIDGEAADDSSGLSVGGAGDVNGDGLADVLVGAPYADPAGDQTGRAYVVFGKADGGIVALATVAAGDGGFAMSGAAAIDRAGYAVAGIGDLDGDGLDDVMVGARQADPNGPDAGRSYVIYGKADGDVVDLAAVATGVGGFAFDGEATLDQSGVAVDGVGDVNGDGTIDLVVGADQADPNAANAGATYVVFGV